MKAVQFTHNGEKKVSLNAESMGLYFLMGVKFETHEIVEVNSYKALIRGDHGALIHLLSPAQEKSLMAWDDAEIDCKEFMRTPTFKEVYEAATRGS